MPSTISVAAYALCPHVLEKTTCDELMVRSEAMADASLLALRARSSPGTAMAAMMPISATTISSSINVNPRSIPLRMVAGASRAP